MITIKARNVQHMLPLVLDSLEGQGVTRDSRNGHVRMFPGPVCLEYARPYERTITWPHRDANPFFHVLESLWMLAGRNDVSFLSRYLGSMKKFSDNGVTFHGAYGYRWRNHWDVDQLQIIIERLSQDPDDRRSVLGMWDPEVDLVMPDEQRLDLPCNDLAMFSISLDGALDMSVMNRSNDIIWGATGANAVHFSFLQEYMAAMIGVPMGTYYQISNNMHAYLETLAQVEDLWEYAGKGDDWDYENTIPLVTDPARFQRDLLEFFAWEENYVSSDSGHIHMYTPSNRFFSDVAVPMVQAHYEWRGRVGSQRYTETLAHCENIEDDAWRTAAVEWVDRRFDRWRKAADDGVNHGGD